MSETKTYKIEVKGKIFEVSEAFVNSCETLKNLVDDIGSKDDIVIPIIFEYCDIETIERIIKIDKNLPPITDDDGEDLEMKELKETEKIVREHCHPYSKTKEFYGEFYSKTSEEFQVAYKLQQAYKVDNTLPEPEMSESDRNYLSFYLTVDFLNCKRLLHYTSEFYAEWAKETLTIDQMRILFDISKNDEVETVIVEDGDSGPAPDTIEVQ